MTKLFSVSLQLATLLVSLSSVVSSPAFAQYQNQSAGAGSYGRSSYSTGKQTNPVYGYQNYYGGTNPGQTPMVRGGMNLAQNGMMAMSSVDNSSFPSAQFSYGFNMSSPTIGNPSNPNNYSGMVEKYRGASGAWSGGWLPPTATSSVDANTCDLPFIQSSSGSSGSGASYPTGYQPSQATVAADQAGYQFNTAVQAAPGVGQVDNRSTDQHLTDLHTYFGTNNP